MKTLEIDEDLYHYIASHTRHIGESASDILRRMLEVEKSNVVPVSSTSSTLVAEAEVDEKTDSRNSANFVHVIRELLLSDRYAGKNKAIGRFMLILSTLYELNSTAFSRATIHLHGRTRVYFARDEQTLLAAGHQSKPRHVVGTPYWVITNTNTSRKRTMVETIMQEMQFPAQVIEKVCGTI